MKKIIVFSIILFTIMFTIIMLFKACKKDTNGLNCLGGSQDSVTLNINTVSPVDFDVKYIRVGSHNIKHPITTVISSINELEQYSEEYRYNKDGYLDIGFINAIEKYSDDFFIDNFLVIVLLDETSGFNRHKVERIDENGDIIINRFLHGIGTFDIATWNVIIEFSNNYKLRQFRTVLIDIKSY